MSSCFRSFKRNRTNRCIRGLSDQNENSAPTIVLRRPVTCFLPSLLTPSRFPLEIDDMTLARLFLALWLIPALAVGDESQVVPLWPGSVPGSEGKKGPEKIVEQSKGAKHDRRVSSIHQPSLTVYLPPREKATGAAIVICPGGGHRVLAIDHEGYEVGQWLAGQGIAGFVLKYRLASEAGSSYTVDVHAMADVQRAIRLVRAHANEWGVDPHRVGLMGFSAGGELAILGGTKFDAGNHNSSDPVDRLGCRPDFLIPIYPGFRGPEFHVSKETPPTFMAVASNDKRCAGICVRLYQELAKAEVPAELHIYTRGGHGFGMHDRPMPVTRWTARLKEWLDDSGFTRPVKDSAAAVQPLGAVRGQPIALRTPVARCAPRQQPARSPKPNAVSPPAARIKAPKGFQVELLYSVPQETQGSWVNMTVDPKGRLIVSDQYGKLYRVTLPPIGRQGRGDRRRADRRADRRGPGPALGLRQPVRGRQPRPAIRQRAVPRHATPTATTGSTRSSCCARSTAAASTARTR